MLRKSGNIKRCDSAVAGNVYWTVRRWRSNVAAAQQSLAPFLLVQSIQREEVQERRTLPQSVCQQQAETQLPIKKWRHRPNTWSDAPEFTWPTSKSRNAPSMAQLLSMSAWCVHQKKKTKTKKKQAKKQNNVATTKFRFSPYCRCQEDREWGRDQETYKRKKREEFDLFKWLWDFCGMKPEGNIRDFLTTQPFLTAVRRRTKRQQPPATHDLQMCGVCVCVRRGGNNHCI